MSSKLMFILMAIAAFISFISFIQINSAASDAKKLHGFWRFMGILFAAVAVTMLYLVMKKTGAI
jgi:hypothetical protein